MKTITFRLFATVITLAAVTTTTTINAQRRSTGSSGSTEVREKSSDERRGAIREKSESRDNAFEKKATERTIKNNSEINRKTKSQRDEEQKGNSDISTRTNQSRQSNYSAIANNVNEHSGRENRSSVHSNNASSNNSENSARSGRVSGVTNRERYHLNDNDERYRVNSNYRGSNNNWTPELRGNYKSNKGNLKSGYNYHWENSWEHYRWNHNSWKNYYSYYDRYSYRHHKNYYHHPYYGHVIRRFINRPTIFIHNHNRYYSYDGHFFRYRPGVGYILVDIPFGMTFEYLPDDFERVYINGYLYFRVGNLFFENTRTGYQLVHYPERYFAYDNDFCNEGFSFEIRIN